MHVVVLLQAPRAAPADDAPTSLEGLAPCERAALELAAELAGNDGDVTALTAGPSDDEVVFSHARALGARRCVRVADPAVDWDNLDAVSSLLSRALQRLGFDVVLTGDRSANWASGVTGPAVAHRLGVPHLRGVVDVGHASLTDLPPLESDAADDDVPDATAAAISAAVTASAPAPDAPLVDDDEPTGFGDEEPTVADNPLRQNLDDEDDEGLSATDTIADDGAGGLAHVDTGEQAIDGGKTVASPSAPTLPPDTASLRQHTTAGPPLAVSVQHGTKLLRVTLPSPMVLTVLACRHRPLAAPAAASTDADTDVELVDLSDSEGVTSTTLRAPRTLASAIADVRPSLAPIERRAEMVDDVPALVDKLRALGVLGRAS